MEHLSQTHGQNSNRGHVKSPIANLREHLHTQGRTRSNQPQLETGPGHQRGGSLNIQDLYTHYAKGSSGTNGRNVTYYTQKGGHAGFNTLEASNP